MKTSLGIGFIGCGEIATETASYVALSPHAHLVMVMDTVERLAVDLGDTYSVPWTTRTEELLSNPDVDAVYIAVPHDLHATLTIDAMTAGKDVLIEKPIAIDLPDVDRMIAAAGRQSRVLSVAFSAQSDPAMIAVKDLIAAGAIGRVTGTRIVKRLDKPDYYWSEGYEHRNADDWRSHLSRAGGGVLMMNAIHSLNTVRFVTGLDVARLYCEFDTFTTPVEVEDFAAVVYRYSNGAIGTVEAASAVAGADPHHEVDRIYGERGQVLLTEEPQVYLRDSWASLPATTWVNVPYEPLGTPRAQPDTHSGLIDGFASACLTRGRPPVTAEDGRAALEIVLAAYRSGRAHSPVTLPLGSYDNGNGNGNGATVSSQLQED
jgi:predicted dehydrogenase